MHDSIQIPLSRGLVALISPEDAERVAPIKWSACEPYPGKLYGCAVVDGKWTYLHRFILQPAPGVKVDHRDGNGLNCVRSNLREATAAQNSQNQRRREPGKHGFIGVRAQRRNKGTRYHGVVTAAGVLHQTRTYSCPILAAAARDVLAEKLHGEYAVKNFRFTPLPVHGAQQNL